MIVLCNQNLRNILFFNLHIESDVWNRPCFPGGSDGKESTCTAGYPGSIPGSGRFPGEGNSHPLQYSCLENPMDRGAGGLQSMGHKESDTVERLTLSPQNRNIILFWLEWELLSPSDSLPYADLWAQEHIVRACLSSVCLWTSWEGSL